MFDELLKETIPRVQERIRLALERAGRRDDVGLVAVTKGHAPAAAAAAVRAGLRMLGENRVQELEEKVAVVGRDAAEWHMIGHLQRNKVRMAVALFDRIHSIDSVRLAQALAREGERAGRPVRGLLQVNVADEATKGGFAGEEVLPALETLSGLGYLRVEGLMTMAPWTDDEAVLRQTFGAARRLLAECRREAPEVMRGEDLSMGMSNDFEIAIEEGATLVRLGTVLFGEREQR